MAVRVTTVKINGNTGEVSRVFPSARLFTPQLRQVFRRAQVNSASRTPEETASYKDVLEQMYARLNGPQ